MLFTFIQVGKRIQILTKNLRPGIQTAATDLLNFWEDLIINENSKKGKKDVSKLLKSEAKLEDSDSSSSAPLKTDKHLKLEHIKVDTLRVDSGSAIYERNNEIETIKVDRISKEEKKTTISIRPPKLTSIIKCNDSSRDNLREHLLKAFSKVPAEAKEDEREEVRNTLEEIDACDPIRVAVTVESAMFDSKLEAKKIRSIMFNMEDAKNTDFRRRVLLGHIKLQMLIDMTVEEMASDERKLSNKHIQEKALFDCEKGESPKATTDQFECSKCGERKCSYSHTRIAGEVITFITCVKCDNKWKIC